MWCRLAAEEERIVMELSNVDKDEAAIREEFEKVRVRYHALRRTWARRPASLFY